MSFDPLLALACLFVNSVVRKLRRMRRCSHELFFPQIRVVSPRLSAHVEQLLESITSILLRESARNLYMVVVEVTPTVSIPRKSARNDVKV